MTRAGPRPGWRVFGGILIVVTALMIGVAGIALAEPDNGPGRGFLDAIESRIRENEQLHYQIHRALGRAFSVCPCTARLSASQYSKAGFHRPRGMLVTP